jgi:hypothetical protein
MNCLRHPQRPAFSICEKFGHGYCEECCTCSDPKGYCRYRTRCVGWRLWAKEGKKKSVKGKA